MTPFLAMPSIQAQLPVQTSSVVGAATEISTMKLPIDATPSPVKVEAVYNNTRGAASPLMAGAFGAASMMGGNSTLTPMISGLDFRPSVQFSSPFLAQLLAQTSGSQMQAVAGFFANDNTPKGIADPALMALYSQVKYKPSNASVPQMSPERNLEVMQNQQQQFMRQLTDQKIQMMQSQIRSEPTTGGTRQMAQASFQAAPLLRFMQPTNNNSNSASASTRGTSVFTGKPLRSLVQPTGIDAYIASFSRNQAHLTEQPESVKVAL